jgi:hypothetical protein
MSDEKRWRDVADMGFDDGYGTAMDEVNKLMHELYAAKQPSLANAVHEVVWQRLMERQDAAMAERKAKRATRDQYAAEIAARNAVKQS